MARPEFKETPCETPSARYGVIKLGGTREAVPTGNEYFPAVQKRSGVEAAGTVHAASAAPTSGGRIIYLGGCEC